MPIGLTKSPVDSPVIGLAPSGAGGAAGPLVLDSFTDSDGTLLTAHAPDVDSVGGGWAVLEGGTGGANPIISSNALLFPLPASSLFPDMVASIETNVANVSISATCEQPAANDFAFSGVVARLSDVNNFWFVYARKNENTLRVSEFNAGSATVRAETAHSEGDGLHSIAVTAAGNTISATINDTSGALYSSASFNATATQHGIIGRRNAVAVRADEITVTAL